MESGIPLTLGIQVPLTKNSKSNTWNPESKIQDSRFPFMRRSSHITNFYGLFCRQARFDGAGLKFHLKCATEFNRLVTGSGLGLPGQRWSSVPRTPSKWFSRAMRRKKDLYMILSVHFLVRVNSVKLIWIICFSHLLYSRGEKTEKELLRLWWWWWWWLSSILQLLQCNFPLPNYNLLVNVGYSRKGAIMCTTIQSVSRE